MHFLLRKKKKTLNIYFIYLCKHLTSDFTPHKHDLNDITKISKVLLIIVQIGCFYR